MTEPEHRGVPPTVARAVAVTAARPWLVAGAVLVLGGLVWLFAGYGHGPLAVLGDDRAAGAGVLGLVVLPGVGCLGFGLLRALRAAQLLQHGATTEGQLASFGPAPLLGWRCLHVAHRYHDADGRPHVVRRWCAGGSGLGRLTRHGQPARVAYDRADPRRAVVFDGTRLEPR